jgi:RNA polymerase sigma-70 factor (ECF subfamily)
VIEKVIGKDISNRLKDSDEKAFEAVFYAWYHSLLRFCNEYIFDTEISRNIVQSVYMKLWERRKSIDESKSLKAFLFTMARNECLSYLRHLKTEVSFVKNISSTFEDQMLAYDALSELDFTHMDLEKIESIINETVASLPDRCREVFCMSRYENLKNREIAIKLNITEKAVEANISRAFKILRVNLKDYAPLIFFLFP